MESVDAFIAEKLASASEELARSEEHLRATEQALHDMLEEGHKQGLLFSIDMSEIQALRQEVDTLRDQVQLLEQIKDLLDKQHAETATQFLAIEKRDERTSKQSVWLTVASSTLSLIAGWLLSLLGNPATIAHAFAH